MDNTVIILDSDSMSEIESNSLSTPESVEENLKPNDEVTSKLKAAGPVGVAAAAAITSVRKSRREHLFERNPAVRKRQRNRLLKKLSKTIDEYTLRVGQQAVVIVAAPGQPSTGYNVFGAKPLKNIVDNMQMTVMQELDNALARQALSPVSEDPSLFQLPALACDGIPTPLDKMTQAQLRTFIPQMLRFSTGRKKPCCTSQEVGVKFAWTPTVGYLVADVEGYLWSKTHKMVKEYLLGREAMRPPWWPTEIPWANVRTDARPVDVKQQMSWKQALCQIVRHCYKYHGREDLLESFSAQETKETETPTDIHIVTNEDQIANVVNQNNPIMTLSDGTVMEIPQDQPVETITDNKNVFNINSMTDNTISPDGQIFVMNEDVHQEPIMANIHSNSDGTITVSVPKFELNSAPQQLVPDFSQQLILPYTWNEPPQMMQLVPVSYDGFKTEEFIVDKC